MYSAFMQIDVMRILDRLGSKPATIQIDSKRSLTVRVEDVVANDSRIAFTCEVTNTSPEGVHLREIDWVVFKDDLEQVPILSSEATRRGVSFDVRLVLQEGEKTDVICSGRSWQSVPQFTPRYLRPYEAILGSFCVNVGATIEAVSQSREMKVRVRVAGLSRPIDSLIQADDPAN